jgi:hypothetical protein
MIRLIFSFLMLNLCTCMIRLICSIVDCRPSCRKLCVDVSHRADSFICSISKPPHAGEVLPKFSVRGRRTVSGCTWAVEEGTMSPLN